ncbi:MAG: hydrogenase expression/formation protein [gamma proteobacterium symbiont of Bathyaustriella thionipta]|nr:hydrogenase expression/formation protein [gamma proteobacterium symbiont of Bathyaustriella thionipta]
MEFDNSVVVNLTGLGSQPAETENGSLGFISLPTEMDHYCAPDMPEPEQVLHLHGAKQVCHWLSQVLAEYRVGGETRMADISALDAANRELVNQILGEGEVSLRYADDDIQVRMQESVLAGLWRTFYLDDQQQILRDIIEVGDVPVLARRTPHTQTAAKLLQSRAPQDVMNALPILTELQEQVNLWQPGKLAHVINLTLLPQSPADLQFLDTTLGTGPVETLSRGYGDCAISSTAYPGIWWVRYTNSMGKLILNTLEVTDIPAVACAAQEDLDDSARRFQELLEPYWAELA